MKIFYCIPSKQFVNQIALLCDENATAKKVNAVKNTLQ